MQWHRQHYAMQKPNRLQHTFQTCKRTIIYIFLCQVTIKSWRWSSGGDRTGQNAKIKPSNIWTNMIYGHSHHLHHSHNSNGFTKEYQIVERIPEIPEIRQPEIHIRQRKKETFQISSTLNNIIKNNWIPNKFGYNFKKLLLLVQHSHIHGSRMLRPV